MNKLYIKSLFVALLLSMSSALFAQTGVAINLSGNTSANPAILDLSDISNAHLGFLMPNINLTSTTDAVTIPAPTVGMIIWNTNAALPLGVGFYYWSGTTWLYLNNSGASSALTGSGTVNYLARWTSATNLGTGIAQDNGTGAAISATPIAPASLLDVKGNVTIGAYAGTNAAPANGVIVSGQVGMGTNAPDASAALDVTSTTQGLLPPRMTAVQMNAIVSPAIGLIVLNTTTNCLEYWSGAAWQNVVCPCAGPPATPGAISGSTTVCASSTGNVYTISAVVGATSYNWTIPSGATITSNTGTSITVTFGAISGNITVTASNSCGTSTASILAVTVTSTPAAPAIPSGSTTPSISSPNTYTIPAVPGATSYSWSSSNTNLGAVTAGGNTTSATITTTATPGTFTICVFAINLCGNSAPTCLTVTSTACSHGSITFNYTGSLQTWNIPNCVSTITVTAYGAQGGGGIGGLGGEAIATIIVTPSTTLDVYVGGNPTTQIGPGGYNGGGASTVDPCGGPPDDGYPGGGASDVRISPYSLNERVIVAGGGGGQGWDPGAGGNGGGLTGSDGANSWVANSQGLGGTQAAGGAGGYYSSDPPATSGSLGQGGAADTYTGLCSGGGGGGGYYGGGGGFVAPGGGGSSYVSYPGNTNTSTTSGINSGNGSVLIQY